MDSENVDFNASECERSRWACTDTRGLQFVSKQRQQSPASLHQFGLAGPAARPCQAGIDDCVAAAAQFPTRSTGS